MVEMYLGKKKLKKPKIKDSLSFHKRGECFPAYFDSRSYACKDCPFWGECGFASGEFGKAQK